MRQAVFLVLIVKPWNALLREIIKLLSLGEPKKVGQPTFSYAKRQGDELGDNCTS